jgi:hypothetical protein
MEPGPTESALTLEFGLVVLAVGAVILLVIVAKLIWERRGRPTEDEPTDK